MNAAVGAPDGVALRQRDGRLEEGDGVVRESPDGAAREAGHAFGRLDPAARDEPADRVERIRRRGRVDRQVGRVLADRHGSRQGASDAVADLEQPARPDAEEAVSPEPLAALDGLEQVGRRRCRRRAGGRPRSASRGRPGRVARSSSVSALAERRFASVRLSGSVVVISWPPRGPSAPGNQERPFVQGRKVVPSAVPPSFGDAALGDRRAEIRRSALPCIAGALRRSLLPDGDPSRFGPEAPGSIYCRRRSGFHQPPDLSADARRVLVPFIARSS